MSKSILVADDDENLLNLYARIFRGKDYSITIARTFSEAAGLIAANCYNLLVTDLIFPDGRGTELIKIFEGKHADARSILVTGSGESEQDLKLDGVSEYFEKPFQVECFMAAVEDALGA